MLVTSGSGRTKQGNLHSVNPFALLPFRQEENNLHTFAKARSRGSYYDTLTWLSLRSNWLEFEDISAFPEPGQQST